jgi:FkbM family methyltransferase
MIEKLSVEHRQDIIKALYRGLLGQEADAQGLASYTGSLGSLDDLSRIIASIDDSPEHRARMMASSIADYPPDLRKRVELAVSCTDCNDLPKVPHAGEVIDYDGERVQLMHDGTKVLAGGYYGDWQAEIITRLRGHHEPQEEKIFYQLLQHVRSGTLMVELGCFWAYYTNWYLGSVPDSRAICLEPDGNHLRIGEANLRLNARSARLIKAGVGEKFAESTTIKRISDKATVHVSIWNYPKLSQEVGGERIEMLHMDVQGAEYGFLRSMQSCRKGQLPRFLVVSTHQAMLDGVSVGHRRCLEILSDLGASILIEHSPEESFSVDGLVVASFDASDAGLQMPSISRYRHHEPEQPIR